MCITSLCVTSLHTWSWWFSGSFHGLWKSFFPVTVLIINFHILSVGYILLQSLAVFFKFMPFGKFIKNEWLNFERSFSQVSSFFWSIFSMILHFILHASHMAHSTDNPGLVQLLFHALQSHSVVSGTWGKSHGIWKKWVCLLESWNLTELFSRCSSVIFSATLLNTYHLSGPFNSELPSGVAWNLRHSSKNVWNPLYLFLEFFQFRCHLSVIQIRESRKQRSSRCLIPLITSQAKAGLKQCFIIPISFYFILFINYYYYYYYFCHWLSLYDLDSSILKKGLGESQPEAHFGWMRFWRTIPTHLY